MICQSLSIVLSSCFYRVFYSCFIICSLSLPLPTALYPCVLSHCLYFILLLFLMLYSYLCHIFQLTYTLFLSLYTGFHAHIYFELFIQKKFTSCRICVNPSSLECFPFKLLSSPGLFSVLCFLIRYIRQYNFFSCVSVLSCVASTLNHFRYSGRLWTIVFFTSGWYIFVPFMFSPFQYFHCLFFVTGVLLHLGVCVCMRINELYLPYLLYIYFFPRLSIYNSRICEQIIDHINRITR